MQGHAPQLLWRARRSEHMQGHADAGAREARRGRKTDAGARATAMLWRARRSEHMQGHADTSDVSETIPEGHVV